MKQKYQYYLTNELLHGNKISTCNYVSRKIGCVLILSIDLEMTIELKSNKENLSQSPII